MIVNFRKSFLQYIAEFIFPVFDELRLIVVLVICGTLCFVNTSVSTQLAEILKDPRSFFLIFFVFILLIGIFTKEKLDTDTKGIGALIYYGFFAVVSYQAYQLQQQGYSGFFDTVSTGFFQLIMLAAILRGVFALLAIREPSMQDMAIQNMSDAQYNWKGFAGSALLAAVSVAILAIFIENPAQLALMSFSTTNAIILLFLPLYGDRVIHRSRHQF